jgi:hypothetical protein
MKYLDDSLPNLLGVHLLPGRGAFGSKQGSLTHLHRAVAGCAVHVRPRAVTLCLRDAVAVHLEVLPTGWNWLCLPDRPPLICLPLYTLWAEVSGRRTGAAAALWLS